MRAGKRTRLVLVAALCAGSAIPASAQGLTAKPPEPQQQERRQLQRERERRDVQQNRRTERRDTPERYRRLPGSQEPAFARGYRDGYQDGLNDARLRNRYDPVGERDYREADQGYFKDYGPKDTYRTNYRAGFRQGYDDGYRERGARR